MISKAELEIKIGDLQQKLNDLRRSVESHSIEIYALKNPAKYRKGDIVKFSYRKDLWDNEDSIRIIESTGTLIGSPEYQNDYNNWEWNVVEKDSNELFQVMEKDMKVMRVKGR